MFDSEGGLYVVVFRQGNITVLASHGSVVTRIATECHLPTNVAFGLTDSKVYVTEDEYGHMEIHNVGAKGYTPFE